VVLVLLALFAGKSLLGFWVDWRWFHEVGYSNVFWTFLGAQGTMGLGFAALFLLISVPNLWLALRTAPPPSIPVDLRGKVEVIARKTLGPLLYAGAVALSVLAGLAATGTWNTWLLYRNAVPFGIADPLFHKDVGYYVFTLPMQQFTLGFVMFSLAVTLIACAFVHGVGAVSYYDTRKGWNLFGKAVPPGSARHLSTLVALVLAAKAAGYWLARYDLLTRSSGVVTGGAGYTDVHARLPVLSMLAVLSALAAVVWIAQTFARRVTPGLAMIVAMVLVSFVGGVLYPSGLEQVRVKPNEFEAEKTYIAHNIAFTRKAYGLDGAIQTDFPIVNDLTPGLIRRNAATIANCRLWDYNIAEQAYKQLQEIKPYYVFSSVDVDRYTLNGQYRQVLISAREMNQDLLPEQAKSFQNQHLVYTHGIGVVMSPVNSASEDGQPTFIVKNIPPTTATDLKLTQPRIYFGETDQDWAVVGTTSTELDYPGTPDVYRNYDGKAGMPVGSGLSRLALSGYVGFDSNFLFSRFFTPQSRLLIHREITERVKLVAPFLQLDHDPYPVVANGRVVWLIDAYTTTDRFPYSETAGDFNYVRNSVKVAVDAYDGTITLYKADPNDPILQAYSKAFPGAFKDLSEMPADLRSHIRYPEDLFNIQSRKYLVYHMTEPRTFFTKEDAWDLPKSARGAVGRGGDDDMEAYYVIMRLPGETQQEMVMIRPFTPRSKNNMIAWMAARCDPRDYGRMVVYRFPIDNLPYGPSQIDASILQKPEISKELTLLNQQGSQVILGNMITLPLEKSLLYVQPLYLQSDNQGNRRAELTRVIAAYGDRVQMGASLPDALNALFGEGGGGEPAAAGPGAAPTGRPAVRRAVAAFERAKALQRSGDWAGYGAALKDLESALKQLERESK
jgi:hypothetical protein